MFFCRKKILAETYRNDYQSERSEDTSEKCPVTIFPRHVVKVIAESPAFCYPELLPLIYSQDCLTKCRFLPSEDVLLIYGLEDLKNCDIQLIEKTKIISTILLPARTSKMIYHRVRNLRKSASTGSQIAKVRIRNRVRTLLS